MHLPAYVPRAIDLLVPDQRPHAKKLVNDRPCQGEMRLLELQYQLQEPNGYSVRDMNRARRRR